ncbi:MAG TPA: allantoicase [Gemmatimonadales bacterium]|nr:allantoicase [Gemmatimonadales bacterium]
MASLKEGLIDLAAARVGGRALAASDEFFAPRHNLLAAGNAVFIEGKYTDRGKWMDGWETRRRRGPEGGYDWCIIRLGIPGAIRVVTVDTTHFRGNYPAACSLDAAQLSGEPRVSARALRTLDLAFVELLPRSLLAGHTENEFAVASDAAFTHVRLKIYPDGGVARLRVYGEVLPDWNKLQRGNIDLAAVENGGLVIGCSDMFFGHRHNLIMPGRALNMSDGWETKRRRGSGHDWVIIKLGAPGQVRRVEVDTSFFRGNFPESCSLDASNAVGLTLESLTDLSTAWNNILPRTKLQAHTRHFFDQELLDSGMVSYLRFNIFPDGGVSRLRVYGEMAE